MWNLDRRARATFALVALASLGAVATINVGAEERHEHRSPREAEPRQNRAAPARAQAPRAQAWQAQRARQYAPPPYHRQMAGRSTPERRLTDARPVRETHFAGGGQVREFSRGAAGGQVRVFRNGNAITGTVEHTIRPGLTSRTFVSGGHVLYTHVYQSHVWHQYGRTFGYETFVPGVRYPMAYYNWALGPWPQPVTFAWGWRVQPWYPVYGALFIPYPVYATPDQWMTDYIISQNMQAAYQARVAVPATQPPAAEWTPAAPAAVTGEASPIPQDAQEAPQPIDASGIPQSGETPPAALPPETPPAQPSGETPAAPVAVPPAALPPTITPQVKAELNTQIKVQLRERQAAAATPATLTTQSSSTPPALRPNHVFFEVVQPLDVPAATANHYCSLSANDYIKRTGGMSQDDWTIPVVVEASGPTDCPVGLHTRIGLNDLNAMENEQEAQVMEAMDAASKRMGPNGPPSGVHPTLIADGRASADPMALDAIRQAQ